MKQTINVHQFRQAFKDLDRDNYSHEAYQVLFDYLEEVYEEDFELDVISICCDFDEYTECGLQNDYGVDNTFNNLSDEIEHRLIGRTENTIIIGH